MRRFDCLERALSSFFSAHILVVLRHPLPFLLAPLLSTVLLSGGLLRLRDAIVKDELELYTPSNAQARQELRQLDALFHINDSDPFYTSRRYDLKRTGYIIVTGRADDDDHGGGGGGDILNPSTLRAAAHLWSVVQSFTIDQEGAVDYPSLCVRFPLPNSLDDAISALLDAKNGHNNNNRSAPGTITPPAATAATDKQFCVSNPLLELFKLAMESGSSTDQLLTHPIASGNSSSLDLNLSALPPVWERLLDKFSLDSLGNGVRGLLGGVSLDAETRRVAGAKALMLPYALKHGTKVEDALAEQWELKLAQFLLQFQSPLIQTNWWTYETLAAESSRDRDRLREWMLPCFLAVSLFSVLLCCTRSPIYSRPLLALCGVFSVASAIASGTGLLLLLGFNISSVTLSMPFIVFSVGVDNVFILLAAWRASSPAMSLQQRMARTFGDAGVSITITSLTDLLSFTVGYLTPFPSVQMFCLFSAVCLLFSYLYQLTIFAALMGLTSLREVQNRHCLTLRKLKPNRRRMPGGAPITRHSTIYTIGGGFSSTNKSILPFDDFAHNLVLSRFFRDHFASFLLNKFVQAVVLLCFGLYLLVSAFGCANIELGLEPLDLLPEHSYGKRALRVTEQYFSEYGGHLHVWMHSLSRAQLGHRRLWLVLEKEIELYEHTEFTGAADSWLRAFLHFQHAQGVFTTNDNFVPRLKQFLRMPRHRKYRRDIRFTGENSTMLEASRVTVRLRFIGFANQSRAMHLFRLLAESSELATGVYADFFLFAEQYNALIPGTVSSIAIAGLAVVLVSLAFIPEPAAALWVSFTIVSTNLGVLGLMPFLSLRLDFISMVTIVMSIGFCVDFSAHLAYNYARGDGSVGSAQRLRNALYAVGTPIMQSASSTVLGVSFLASTESYIFRSFFKTIILVIVLGVLHGLIILPVLLTVLQRDSAADQWNLEWGGERNDRKERVVPSGIKNINTNRPTAIEISAPIPCASNFSSSPASYMQSPFSLILRRANEVKREESLYSKMSTVPIGDIRRESLIRKNEHPIRPF